MKRKMSSLLAFGAVCAITPFVVRPVTIVEVTAASTGGVQVHGWIQIDETGPRVGLEPRSTPFRLVLKGADVQARFTTQEEDQTFEVRAVQRRAWIPLVRVEAVGSRISLDGRGSHMGMRAR